MANLIEETTLHFEDETFKKLRDDADQVLQKLLANMAEKGSPEGKLTITLDVVFDEESIADKKNGGTRLIHTPKFQHKVGSVLQIKNEQKGDMNCDGMEMVWDEEKNEYVLRSITGKEQMSIFDMEFPEEPEEEVLQGRKVIDAPKFLPEPVDAEEVVDEPTEENMEYPEDNPEDDDLGDYEYEEPEEE